jgi:hypothetical protein
MPNLKFTTIFGSDEGRGWSETHLLQVGVDPGDLLPYVQDWKNILDNLRRPLLGMDRYIQGFRVSFPTAAGAIASSAYRYQPLSYPGNTRPGCAPSVAAEVRFGDATNTKFSNCFLRGFWRDVQKNEVLDFDTAAGSQWKQLLDQWVGTITARGYGWQAQDPVSTSRGKMVSYTVDADNFVTFTVAPTNGVLLPAVGTKLSIRFARINNSNSVLNRTLIVQMSGVNTCVTVVPIAAGGFVSAGTYVANVSSFAAYSGVQYVVLARKPEGRPIGQSPARLKAQART